MVVRYEFSCFSCIRSWSWAAATESQHPSVLKPRVSFLLFLSLLFVIFIHIVTLIDLLLVSDPLKCLVPDLRTRTRRSDNSQWACSLITLTFHFFPSTLTSRQRLLACDGGQMYRLFFWQRSGAHSYKHKQRSHHRGAAPLRTWLS